jgi:hypothetical protein
MAWAIGVTSMTQICELTLRLTPSSPSSYHIPRAGIRDLLDLWWSASAVDADGDTTRLKQDAVINQWM